MNYKKKKLGLIILFVLIYSILATSTLVYAQDKEQEEENPPPPQPKPEEEDEDNTSPPQPQSSPAITISPNQGSYGENIVIYGSGFPEDGPIQVHFDNYQMPINSQAVSSNAPYSFTLHTTVPITPIPPTPNNEHTITVTMGITSASNTFTIVPTPTQSNDLTLTPNQGEPGSTVVLSKTPTIRPPPMTSWDLTVNFGSSPTTLEAYDTAVNLLYYAGDIGEIVVPDMDMGTYTVEVVFRYDAPTPVEYVYTGTFVVEEDQGPTTPTDPPTPTTPDSPWDHLTSTHNDAGSFGEYVQDMDAKLESWFQPGGSIYQIVAESNSYTSQIDWSDIARIESELLAVQSLCQDIPTGISPEQIQEILNAIDALELQLILDALNDESRFTDDVELSLLRQALLDAIGSIDLQDIEDILGDETRYTDDAELAQLQNEITILSDTVTSLINSYGLSMDARFTVIEQDLSNLEAHIATSQQVDNLETQIMGILGDEQNFVSDSELDNTVSELTGVLTATIGGHSELILAEIQALDWTPIVETYAVVQAIQGDMNANFASLNTRMDTIESLLLEPDDIPNSVGVQIEKADSKSYYILTTLNGQPYSAELTITIGGKAVTSKEHTVSEIATGLYSLEFKGKAGSNKDPIVAVARIEVEGESLFASSIQVLQ